MTPILSTATLSQVQILRYVGRFSPNAAYAQKVAQAYYTIAHKEYGLNVPAVIAQALHETGNFTSWWTTNANNFCGLGVTDGDWQHGWAFPTIELGVHAHCAHLLGYTATPHNSLCRVADPRHNTVTIAPGIHLGRAATILDLDNAGWSAVSAKYGTAVQAIYDAMAKA